MRSWPRVYGTTQKLQYSLQPSMIVTHARTGSSRRVDPERKRDVVVGAEIDLRRARVSAGLLDQHGQHAHTPRADDDVDHGRSA